MPSTLPEIDLIPPPGKVYFNCDREWCEEFIYFVIVDRFDDNTGRVPVLGPGRTIGTTVSVPQFYGGKIAGITRNLDYIANLGCTAIWLSPVLETNAYHGYDISSYLDVDPHFGTKQDLIDLVNAAHAYQKGGLLFPIKIILDVVINHSGDNWAYPGGYGYNYSGGQHFDFGFWRKPDRPMPTELRNTDFYHRCGQISGNGYDTAPENKLGDLFALKDFHNDDDATGSAVINALIKSYCYWIREVDFDGFRVDAVKHMEPLACSRFCSNIREYAESLGKKDFFLFGELATPNDDVISSYIGPNTSVQSGTGTVYFGLDSVLDFLLAESAPGHAKVRDVLKGFADPSSLFSRLDGLQNRALNRGQSGRYLVTFVDNHDYFWQDPGGRFGNGAPELQIVGAVGFLLCNLGTPCLYYGTEQGFSGTGGDEQIREAMFDMATPGTSKLNSACNIYQEISKIAKVMRSTAPLKFGRMYYRQISGNGTDFGMPFGCAYTLAFSRMLYGSEVLVAYNVSSAARSDFVVVDSTLSPPGSHKTFLYGGTGAVPVNYTSDGLTANVQLHLGPYQLAILG